jgi:hypothetical protein
MRENSLFTYDITETSSNGQFFRGKVTIAIPETGELMQFDVVVPDTKEDLENRQSLLNKARVYAAAFGRSKLMVKV